MDRRRKRARLSVQILEDRCLLNADVSDFIGLGNHTISIAPDETQFGQQSSNLASVFDQRFGADAWRGALRDAAQAWVPHANVNFGFVGDDGSPAGIQGPWRRDERFGDIRVFGVELDESVWAQAIGGNARVTGTWAGDFVFNTNANWTSLEQVHAAAVHEIGHVLGLQHSDEQESVMNSSVSPLNTDPSEADIEALQSLFGERDHDYADLEKRNDSIKRASRISGSGDGNESEEFNGSQIWLQFGDISVADDVDYYRINLAPNAVGEMTVGVKTGGLGLASLEAKVLTRDGDEIATAGVDPDSDWTLMTIDPSIADRVYVMIDGVSKDQASIGGYGVLVAAPGLFATSNEVNTTWVETAYLWHQNSKFGDRGYSYHVGDAIGGSIWSLADELLDGTEPVDIEPMVQASARTVYTAIGELVTVNEIEQYSIELPREIEPNQKLRIEIHSLDRHGVVPDLQVVSLSGGSLESLVTFRGNGVTQLVVQGITADERVMIQVKGGTVSDEFKVGAFNVYAELSSVEFNEVTLIDGQVDQARRSVTSTFTLPVPKIAKFNLFGASHSLAAEEDGAALVFEIYDGDLNRLHAFAGPIDDLRSMPGIVLPTGTYHAKVSSAYQGAELLSISAKVAAEFLSDPIGPLAPPSGQDPMLECLIGGSLCLPGSEDHELPIVVVPDSPVLIPDEIWLEPINLGDDWYWDNSVVPVSQPAGDGDLGGVTEGADGGVMIESATTEIAGTESVLGVDAGTVSATGNDGGVGTGSTTFGASNAGISGAGVVTGFSAGVGGSISGTINSTTAGTGGSSNASSINGFGSAAFIGTALDSTSDALFGAANEIANVDRVMSGFAAGVDNQLDVNGDQLVTAADALVIINFIASHRAGNAENSTSSAMDSNGDGQVTALDVLKVINQISRVR